MKNYSYKINDLLKLASLPLLIYHKFNLKYIGIRELKEIDLLKNLEHGLDPKDDFSVYIIEFLKYNVPRVNDLCLTSFDDTQEDDINEKFMKSVDQLLLQEVIDSDATEYKQLMIDFTQSVLEYYQKNMDLSEEAERLLVHECETIKSMM